MSGTGRSDSLAADGPQSKVLCVWAWLLLSGTGRSESLAADGDVSMGQTAVLSNSGSVSLAEESPLS